MEKVLIYALALVACVNAEDEISNPSESGLKICEPGSQKMVDCNRCTCLNDGSGWGCTRRFCSLEESSTSNPDITPIPETGSPSESVQQVCEPRSTTWDGCNTCFCTIDGSGWGCTQRSCHWEQLTVMNPDMTPTSDTENTSEPGLKTCEPGSTMIDMGHRCDCVKDGSAWTCAKMDEEHQEISIMNRDVSPTSNAENPSQPNNDGV